MHTINQLLKNAVKILKASSETPVLDAELIFIYTMHKHGYEMNKIKIITNGGNHIPDEVADYFIKQINKREMGTPVQYITNVQEFMGLELYVEEGVLIPRADTEIIVEKVIELCKKKEKVHVLDMCTGSGAIAASIAYYIPDSKIIAVDISQKAIECSNINLERHKLSERVAVINSNLFEAIGSMKLNNSFDVIVSNPPYISTEDINKLAVNVKDYEPILALDGGNDGLNFYKAIIREAHNFLKQNGILCFEIGYNQGESVIELMKQSGYYTNINIQKDLAGLDRCVFGFRYR